MTQRRLTTLAADFETGGTVAPPPRPKIKPGSRLVREWHGRTHTVSVTDDGFEFQGKSYRSLTKIARDITGARWSGPRFFGLTKQIGERGSDARQNGAPARNLISRTPMVRFCQDGSPARRKVRCAVYTRKSSEEGLEQEFNSLDAQREACEAYITSQKHEGWTVLAALFDDGAYSGGTMDRPALQRLLDDARAGKIDVVVVYKVDRLTRSLADFAKIVEVFDAQRVSFVSVTQAFNTTTSMGRLDPQRAAVVRPVRARGDGRTHPRQDRRVEKEGHVDGRTAHARLRRQGTRARRQ